MAVTVNDLAAVGIAPQAAEVIMQAIAQAASGGSYTLPAASVAAIGGVKMAANVANAGESSATDVAGAVSDLNTLATKFNAVLAGMQAAGQMASS
ncbi:MAG: head fiber protein [Acetobacter papayae]